MTPEEQKLWDGIKDMPVGHARQLLFESCLKRDRLRAELASKDAEIARLRSENRAEWHRGWQQGAAHQEAFGEHYANETVLQARAEHLKSVLAKVLRSCDCCSHCEYDEAEGELVRYCDTCCRRNLGMILAILNERRSRIKLMGESP